MPGLYRIGFSVHCSYSVNKSDIMGLQINSRIKGELYLDGVTVNSHLRMLTCLSVQV